MKGFIGSIVTALVIVVLLVGGISCIEKIPVGYEGVQYSVSGGVKDETLGQGWHLVSPTIRVKEFTISNEQLVLTKDSREGSETDESFKVATSDDASISIDFQMSYRFIPEKLVETYKKFKGMDGNDIVQNRVRTVLKSKVSEITTNYSLMDIYSGNRKQINDELTDYLNKELRDFYGIEVIDASIINSHPDENLKKTIEARVQAQQSKAQAKAEQDAIKVKAETELIQAKKEAEIKVTEAEAEAEANRVISESITENLIRMKEAEARLQHGWVTIQGADSVIADERNDEEYAKKVAEQVAKELAEAQNKDNGES